jgi:uncharacterized coiled-coil protein SlyX
MNDDERIRVGATSDGVAADVPAGQPVELPVIDLMTGRAFLTGKSGSGKSNTASVVIEKLLDRGLPVLVVDIDGEYYGLKEEYEILHVGADEECDLVVNEEHAGKLAELALEQNVPIILDVSSFLDESEARDLLTAVARNLFAKEKKLKQPFLLVVEEVHEYIPEGGGLDECGRMLIKAAKRGRKHGLGVVGVSQRPADVKKDFITQCDWLVWHRLTWENDTKVVRRLLGSEYADAIDGMADGEAFVLTDWSERVRRVQFDRKETFDAGATPGLEDFERPELKSVSSDLVQDLEAISEEEERRESRIQELERQLADREQRIEELEAELSEAEDLSKMAERFSRAMMEHASGRAFRADIGTQTEMDDWRKRAVEGEHLDATRHPANPTEDYLDEDGGDREAEVSDDEPRTETTVPAGWPETDEGSVEAESSADGSENGDMSSSRPTTSSSATAGSDAIDAAFEALEGTDEGTDDAAVDEVGGPAATATEAADTGSENSTSDGVRSESDPATRDAGEFTDRPDAPGADAGDDGWPEFGADAPEEAAAEGSTVETVVEASDPGFEREVVREAKMTIRGFDAVTRRMLAHYREHGACDPVDAHVAAGGDGDRTRAYSRNRALRQADLVAHAGRGRYGCRLAAHLREAHGDRLPESDLAAAIESVERAFVDEDTGAERAESRESAAGRTAAATERPDAGGTEEADADATDAGSGDGTVEPDDDASFIDADAVRDDNASAASQGSEGGTGGVRPGDTLSPNDTEREPTVADASDDGSEQFRTSEERSATDGGETDEFPKWPGE